MPELSVGPAKRPVRVIYILLFLFASPFVLSWWMYHFTELGRDGGAYSHGHLILPPRPMQDLILSEPGDAGRDRHLYGKWNLLYISGGKCDQRCDQRLALMKQLSLAAGKDSYRLQRVLMITGLENKHVYEEQLKQYRGVLVVIINDADMEHMADLFRHGDEVRPLDADRLYLIDPLGNLLMSYAPEVDPNGIIKDLKRLLKYSRIG